MDEVSETYSVGDMVEHKDFPLKKGFNSYRVLWTNGRWTAAEEVFRVNDLDRSPCMFPAEYLKALPKRTERYHNVYPECVYDCGYSSLKDADDANEVWYQPNTRLGVIKVTHEGTRLVSVEVV
jgi:hypothetical protein